MGPSVHGNAPKGVTPPEVAFGPVGATLGVTSGSGPDVASIARTHDRIPCFAQVVFLTRASPLSSLNGSTWRAVTVTKKTLIAEGAMAGQRKKRPVQLRDA